MPEIKTKHKSQPVLNTAQQHMQRTGSWNIRILPAITQRKKSPGRQGMPFGMRGHYCSMKFVLFVTVTAPRNPRCLRKTPVSRKSYRRFSKIVGKYVAELREMPPPSARGSM